MKTALKSLTTPNLPIKDQILLISSSSMDIIPYTGQEAFPKIENCSTGEKQFDGSTCNLLTQSGLSAYDVKNSNRLFGRLFKVKKDGVFLFGISFFVLEIFRFLYYANEGSDDVIDRFTKTIKY